MKISYIHGICVRNDAISNSIRDEITWLRNEGRNDVCLYAYACDHGDMPFKKVSDLSDVVFDPHFQSSDLVVFHFGVYYPLFDLLAVTPKSAKRLVVFHNITPKQFLPVENHPTIDKSFKQMANIILADHVACDSQTNLDVLRAAGIHTAATVMSLAVQSNLQMPDCKPSHLDGVVRLAFIGRFVRSKGPGELLEALDKVLQDNKSVYLTLDMVGNLSFSDQALLQEIQRTVDAMSRIYEGRLKINIYGDASEKVKYQVLRDADLFILPTYHEGFCVPIVEAFASGCKVIAYENSNIPAISGGFAKLTTTGDVAALSRAIEKEISNITAPVWRSNDAESYAEYINKVREYVKQYSHERVKQCFLEYVRNVIC